MDAYEHVTEAIIAQMENGIIPWRKPFATIDGTMNYVSRKCYSTLNNMLLSRNGEYLTPKQAMELKGDFKGAKTEVIYFFKMVEKKVKKAFSKTEEETTGPDSATDMKYAEESYPVLKSYRVLHISDVKGVESKLEKIVKIGTGNPRIDEIEALVNDYLTREGITLNQDAYSKASYIPGSDTINMPPMDQFESSEAYYATFFHVLAHSTGTKTRLNRDLSSCSNKNKHSREELVAEMTAAMLCNHFEIDTIEILDNSARYIKEWTDKIRADKYMVVWAAGRAEKAVKRILGITV